MKIFLIKISLILMLGIFSIPAWADEPVINEIEPNSGYACVDTDVTVTGEGFDPDAKVALMNGGPFPIGSLDMQGVCDIAVSGDYVYATSWDGGFHVIDVSSPQDPILVGSLDTPVYARDIEASEGYAYLVGENGLQIIDVNDPANPFLAGGLDIAGYAIGIAVSGGYAYVACYCEGFKVIDISNPEAPFLAGSLNTGCDRYVVISGEYAYLAGDYGLQVIDISNPVDPFLAGHYYLSLSYGPSGLAVSNQHAYVSNYEASLEILEISDPTSPSYAGYYLIYPDSAHSVVVAESYAYLSTSAGLEQLDISDPSAPFLVGTCYVVASDIALSEGYAYVAGDFLGVYDISNSPPLSFVGSMKDVALFTTFAASGLYTYIAKDDSFQVIDVSNPKAPSLVGSCAVLEEGYDIEVSGGYAYLTGSNYLQVFDIGNSTAPFLAGSCATPHSAAMIELSGGYAYLASSNYFQVFDISNPAAPFPVGYCNVFMSYGPYGLAVTGGYAYLVDTEEVTIIDVNDPANPFLAGSYATQWGQPIDIAVLGGYAFVIDVWYEGVQVLDISNPAAPFLAGILDTQGYPFAIEISEAYLYVLNYRGAGIQVFDISNPNLLVPAGIYYVPFYDPWDIKISGVYAYAIYGGSACIIKINPQLRNVTISSGNEIHPTIPAGYTPGPYNILVHNPNDEVAILHNGYMVSECIDADIDFDSDILNLKNKGKWMTCYIEVPDEYTVSDIDASTITLSVDDSDFIYAEPYPMNIMDHDCDGILELMIKFDRNLIQKVAPVGDAVPFEVTGKISETNFIGTDFIKVFD